MPLEICRVCGGISHDRPPCYYCCCLLLDRYNKDLDQTKREKAAKEVEDLRAEANKKRERNGR